MWWVLAGAHGPIERSRLDAIPPYVMNAMKSDARPRLLAIDLIDGTARYSVLADDHLRLGDADRGFTLAAPFLPASRSMTWSSAWWPGLRTLISTHS